jgi:translation elongation factor EF-G
MDWKAKFNAIANQIKSGVDSLKSEDWNYIINVLRLQANNNTKGIETLFKEKENIRQTLIEMLGDVSIENDRVNELVIIISEIQERFSEEVLNGITTQLNTIQQDLENKTIEVNLLIEAFTQEFEDYIEDINQNKISLTWKEGL